MRGLGTETEKLPETGQPHTEYIMTKLSLWHTPSKSATSCSPCP
ncbi:hypothetical protein [Eikenella exigua]|nr:hypothetical protein [Eikenella exigua]